MKKEMLLIVLILFLIGNLMTVNPFSENNKIDSDVYKSLEKNEKTKVIIEIKEPNPKKGFLIKKNKTEAEIIEEKQGIKKEVSLEVGIEDVNHVFDKHIAVEITNEELNKLITNPDIESVKIDKPIKIFLQDSTSLVNATNSWKLQLNNTNLTGKRETVCILDTGVDFTHADLVGKNKTCIIDCVGKACVENCSKGDDHGHGTHVAGIIAASGGIIGIAPEVSLIGVKIMNFNGQGSWSDIDAGIDWCMNYASTYNISVITMSLGTDCDLTPRYCYSSYCDSEETTTTPRINNATLINISVIAASGNNGNTVNISSPACITNITAVGATDKTDAVASYSNRNSLIDLFAPGGSSSNKINSTKAGGNYEQRYGTSMAAPHIAAAFAIIRELYELQNNRTLAPSEIQSILNYSGKQIYDSGTGLTFSRINIYKSILSNDNISPVVNLIYPANNQVNSTNNYTFYCNSSDWQLANITLYLWNSTSDLVYNETKNISGITNATSFNYANLENKNYKWNCMASDLIGNYAFADSNFTLLIGVIKTNITSPLNSTYKNINDTNFTCNSSCSNNLKLKNITFYLWNSTSDLVYNETKNISGITNASSFNYSLTSEGEYYWNCLSFNNESNSSFADYNFSVFYDITNPGISSIISSPDSTSSIISFTSNENCNTSVNYGTDYNLGTRSNDSVFSAIHSVSISSLASSTAYYYNISYCDRAGNCITNGTYSFATSAAQVVNNLGLGGGGGGGGGDVVKTYKLNSDEISEGSVKQVEKNEQIKFVLDDSIEHILIINEIKDNSANITIRSEPINLILVVGEERKLNLTSKDYYDLKVRLISIENKKANISVQKINESILKEESSEKEFGISDDNKEMNLPLPNNPNNLINKLKILIYVLIVVGIALFFVFLLLRRKLKGISKKQKINKKNS